MKSIMTLVIAAVLLVTPLAVQNANAQLELSFVAGLNAPQGDYGDHAKNGYALGAGIGYRFFPYAVLGFETFYNGNKASDEAMASEQLDLLRAGDRAGLVLLEDVLYRAVEAAHGRPKGLPVVVPFPGPSWRGLAPEERVLEILRRAIGYRVKLR